MTNDKTNNCYAPQSPGGYPPTPPQRKPKVEVELKSYESYKVIFYRKWGGGGGGGVYDFIK
jgi:hypothetical protein